MALNEIRNSSMVAVYGIKNVKAKGIVAGADEYLSKSIAADG